MPTAGSEGVVSSADCRLSYRELFGAVAGRDEMTRRVARRGRPAPVLACLELASVDIFEDGRSIQSLVGEIDALFRCEECVGSCVPFPVAGCPNFLSPPLFLPKKKGSWIQSSGS